MAALANVAAVHHHQQQQQQHLNQQSLNANNAFLTPGSTTNAQNENVNQQLQQVIYLNIFHYFPDYIFLGCQCFLYRNNSK